MWRRGSTGTEERRDKERTDETTGAGEKEITAGSDRVVEINVARLIGATEECACGPSGSQPARARCVARTFSWTLVILVVQSARVSSGRYNLRVIPPSNSSSIATTGRANDL